MFAEFYATCFFIQSFFSHFYIFCRILTSTFETWPLTENSINSICIKLLRIFQRTFNVQYVVFPYYADFFFLLLSLLSFLNLFCYCFFFFFFLFSLLLSLPIYRCYMDSLSLFYLRTVGNISAAQRQTMAKLPVIMNLPTWLNTSTTWVKGGDLEILRKGQCER